MGDLAQTVRSGAHLAPPSAPRLRQTLSLLLKGLPEKQIAYKLSLSRHTVHVYVKSLYRRYAVTSLQELMSLWVGVADPPNLQPPSLLARLFRERAMIVAKLAALDARIAAQVEVTSILPLPPSTRQIRRPRRGSHRPSCG